MPDKLLKTHLPFQLNNYRYGLILKFPEILGICEIISFFNSKVFLLSLTPLNTLAK